MQNVAVAWSSIQSPRYYKNHIRGNYHHRLTMSLDVSRLDIVYRLFNHTRTNLLVSFEPTKSVISILPPHQRTDSKGPSICLLGISFR